MLSKYTFMRTDCSTIGDGAWFQYNAGHVEQKDKTGSHLGDVGAAGAYRMPCVCLPTG